MGAGRPVGVTDGVVGGVRPLRRRPGSGCLVQPDRGIDERGGVHRVQSARVNYQSVADGGCSNTEVSVTAAADGPAWLHSTSTERRTRPGTPLRLADPR